MEVSRRALGLMASLGKPHRFAWPSDIANALGIVNRRSFRSFFWGGRLGSGGYMRCLFSGGRLVGGVIGGLLFFFGGMDEA